MAQLRNTTINDTGNLTLPVGTTAQRPASPAAGMIRYNTTLQDTEYFDGIAWRPISEANPEATGGTVTDTIIGGVPYRIHTFTSTGNSSFTVTRSGEVEYLIVAGGGGGSNRHRGGGGAGGVLQGITRVVPQTYTITVGAGGNGVAQTNLSIEGTGGGSAGGNSSAFGLTALGGGAESQTGGSGGGGGAGGAGGSGTAGQGNSGGNGSFFGSGAFTAESSYNGGGGGGAGSPGLSANSVTPGTCGDGGQGIMSAISGVPRFYGGGGGGGGASSSVRGGFGGLGGGGNGGPINGVQQGQNGAPNTGGGGGSGAFAGITNFSSGGGGTGIVIVRYRLNEGFTPSATTTFSTLPSTSPTDFIVNDGLVLNFDASNPLSYAGSGAFSGYSSTGTVWRNLANTLNNGTINGDIVFERGGPNNGYFIFNNSPFVATSNFFLGNGPTAWTVNAWILTSTTADGLGQGAIASNASGGPVYSSLGVNLGRISYWTYVTDWQRRIGNITVNDSRWHLLTWVNYPNSTMDMYVDGRIDVGAQAAGSGNNNPIDRFGGSWAGRFDGRISQITMNINRFWTASEVLAFFNATRWRFGV